MLHYSNYICNIHGHPTAWTKCGPHWAVSRQCGIPRPLMDDSGRSGRIIHSQRRIPRSQMRRIRQIRTTLAVWRVPVMATRARTVRQGQWRRTRGRAHGLSARSAVHRPRHVYMAASLGGLGAPTVVYRVTHPLPSPPPDPMDTNSCARWIVNCKGWPRSCGAAQQPGCTSEVSCYVLMLRECSTEHADSQDGSLRW